MFYTYIICVDNKKKANQFFKQNEYRIPNNMIATKRKDMQAIIDTIEHLK
jgi:hypothetical protein